jgi:EAL domain-containing protein (putative c-di-GMP-specific phosphodiesterase class I)
MPDDFIPLAEETGLIVPLGRWLRAEACRQVRAWHVRFPAHSPWQLSVNLSTREFRQPGLVADLARTLAATGLSPQDLTLEITESVTIADVEVAVATMREMKGLGMRLALDDFGTGYASLSALRRIPVDEIKVDHSFVAGLGTHHEDIAIVRASVGVAKALGLRVIAEGVERAEQVAQLRELGCERGQGHYFAPPYTAEELDILLQERLSTRNVAEAACGIQVTGPVPDPRLDRFPSLTD